MISATSLAATRESIRATETLIRPYIRRTPVIELDGAEFGFESIRLWLKLELLQHTGSFKPRGAFAGMLTRDVPAVGVVAASGGNHGVAVAYAAQQLSKPARIFVPTVSSPTKTARIRGYGAELVITGDRYNDALAASEQWAAESGALPIHAYDQPETLLGQGTVGLEFEEQAPGLDTLAGGRGRRRIDRRRGRMVRGRREDRRRGAGSRANALERSACGTASRFRGGRHRGRFARARNASAS